MLEAFGLSDPGCVRSNNEDTFLLAGDLGLYVVADGMGGAQAGEHASRIAVDTVLECVRRSAMMDSGILVRAFEEANRRVLLAASADSKLEGMGTTLVAALVKSDEIMIASVGDSRAYVFEDGKLRCLTEDQTWVNEVGRRLGLDDSSLKTHRMRHVLTMAVGVSHPLRVHSATHKAGPKTQILLSSDGLHGVVDQKIISEVLSREISLGRKCHSLIEAARRAGGPDNITVVLLRPASTS